MKKKTILLSAILCAAFSLRLVFIFTYREGAFTADRLYASDALIYHSLADNIRRGNGLADPEGNPTARREPVYPLFLAFVYLFSHGNFFLVRILQSLTGTLLCLLIYLIGKSLFGRDVGLLASLLGAFYYPFIQLSAYVMPENVGMVILALFVFRSIRSLQTPSPLNFFTAGVVFGLAALSRGTIYLFLPVFSVWAFFLLRGKKALRCLAFLFLGVLIFTGPWIFRNALVFGKFIPATTRFGDVMYQGHNPLAGQGGGGWWLIGKDYSYPREIEGMDELERNRYLTKESFSLIKRSPSRVIKLAVKKTINMWRPFYSNTSTVSKAVMCFSYIPVMILGVRGIYKNFKPRETSFLLFLLVACYVFVHAALLSTIRYRWAVMPYFIVYAAFSLNYPREKFCR